MGDRHIAPGKLPGHEGCGIVIRLSRTRFQAVLEIRHEAAIAVLHLLSDPLSPAQWS